MKKILPLFLLFITAFSFGQVSTRCAVCPPSLSGVTTGWVLTDSAGKARWKMLPINDTIDEWSLTGNAGTTGANFIGTTDKHDLILKAHSIQVGWFDIESGGDNVGIGVNSILTHSGFGNTAVGTSTLVSVSSNGNTAMGASSLNAVTTGGNNVALGYTAGQIGNPNNRLFIDAIGRADSISQERNSLITGIFGVDSSVQKLRVNGSLQISNGTQGNGNVLTSDATGLASWQNHLGTQSNHLLYAYIDTVHTLGTSVYIGNAHVSQTTAGTGIATDSVKTTWLGDLSGSNTTYPTVAKLNGVAAINYVTLTGSQTLTNKTLTTPVGIVKSDVGLGNVDNTSDATKNAASVTLTNKTINSASNTVTLTASTISNFAAATQAQLSALSTYTTPALATTGLGSGKPYILSTTIGIVNVLLLSITP